jgi:hypothetical protein
MKIDFNLFLNKKITCYFKNKKLDFFFYQINKHYSSENTFPHEPNKSPKLITNQGHVIKEPNKKIKIK